MLKAPWLKILAAVIGLAALCTLLWFGGPLLAVGDARPFESPLVRGGLGLLAGTAAALYFVYDIVNRSKQAGALARGLGGEIGLGGSGAGGTGGTASATVTDDGDTLKGRMADALATLKKASGSKGDPLYDLPWYMMIGPPGSGKTTALINSGLKFPLTAGGATPAAIAGEGGTRYCDWWFTEEAVLIDTAGRYTTQDSDAQADKASWKAFLQLLRTNRPKQPVNGVFVCISIEDLLRLNDAQLRAHADAIRSRLKELHEELKVDFPVYALFTKADLVAGFMEFFGLLTEEERRVVWGVTFQTNDKTANMVTQVPDEFDLLIERLNEQLIDRVQEEPTPQGKVMIFGFPSQMAALKQPVFAFLNQIFEPTRYHANATLRGYYFTSGTQEGTPIDQLVGALSRSFGAEMVGQVKYSGRGKSFFLTDLMQKVVFAESGWVSTNVKAVRRASLLRGAGYAALLTAVTGAGAWMWLSYVHNSDLVSRSFAALTQYKTTAGPLRDETTIADADLTRIHTSLHALRTLPAGFAQRDEPTPLKGQAGLDQRPRLNASAETAYEQGLQRMLRPRLMFRLEDVMRRNLTAPAALMEPLGVYLALTGREPMIQARVVDYFRQDLERQFAGAGNAAGRQALLEHIQHLMTLEPPTGPAAIEPDHALIQEAQGTIGRMTIADRAFELLRTGAAVTTDRDWVAARKGGQDTARVFTSANAANLDDVRIPFFYTYAGFHDAFLARIPAVADQVRQERRVLGDLGAQGAIQSQYEQLPQQLHARYSREFIATWERELRKLRIRPLTADRPRYLALEAAASPTSPITQLIESIREETALTRPRPQPQGQAQPAPARPPLILPAGEVPGAQVEAAFRAYALLVEGDRSRRPVDDLNRVLNEVYTALNTLNDPVRAAEGRQKFAESLRSFEVTAGRFPEPFKGMLQGAAASFDSDATGTAVARLNQGVIEQITAACQQAVTGVYPFVRTSTRDMRVEDFRAMFGPNGVIDRFFQTNLAQYAVTGERSWSWNQASPIGRALSPRMLQSFQQAQDIRNAFFPSGAPGFSFAVRNLQIGEDVDVARLEINAQQLVTEKPPAPPQPGLGSLFGGAPPPARPAQPPQTVTFQWPGPVNLGGAALTLLPEAPGRVNTLRREGPWGVFRLLDQVNVTGQGGEITARASVGGRQASYQINAMTLPSPFTLAALRSFTCPTPR